MRQKHLLHPTPLPSSSLGVLKNKKARLRSSVISAILDLPRKAAGQCTIFYSTKLNSTFDTKSCYSRATVTQAKHGNSTTLERGLSVMHLVRYIYKLHLFHEQKHTIFFTFHHYFINTMYGTIELSSQLKAERDHENIIFATRNITVDNLDRYLDSQKHIERSYKLDQSGLTSRKNNI